MAGSLSLLQQKSIKLNVLPVKGPIKRNAKLNQRRTCKFCDCSKLQKPVYHLQTLILLMVSQWSHSITPVIVVNWLVFIKKKSEKDLFWFIWHVTCISVCSKKLFSSYQIIPWMFQIKKSSGGPRIGHLLDKNRKNSRTPNPLGTFHILHTQKMGNFDPPSLSIRKHAWVLKPSLPVHAYRFHDSRKLNVTSLYWSICVHRRVNAWPHTLTLTHTLSTEPSLPPHLRT